jgi:hypothetical protein
MHFVHPPNNNNNYNNRDLQACADNNNSSNSNIMHYHQWIVILSIASHPSRVVGTEAARAVLARVCTRKWARTGVNFTSILQAALSYKNNTFILVLGLF